MSNNRTSSWASGVILALAALYLFVVVRYSVNVPYLDDYDEMLGHLLRANHTSGLAWWLEMFSERTVHRPILYHFTNYLFYTLTGHVSFTGIIILNALIYLAGFVGVLRLGRQLQVSPLWQVALALLYIAPQAISTHWSSSGMVYYPTIVGTIWMWTFLMDEPNRRSLLLAGLSTLFAFTGSAAGVLTALVALPLLWRRYDRKVSVVWLLMTAVIVALYFIGNGGESHDQGAETGFIGLVVRVISNMVFYLAGLWRPLFGSQELLYALPALGWVIAAAYLARSVIRKASSSSWLISAFGFAVLLGLMLSAGRARYGMTATFAYRYEIFHLMPWLLLLMAYIIVEHPAALAAKICIAVLLVFGAIRWGDHVHRLSRHADKLAAYHDIYQATGDPAHLIYKYAERGKAMYDEAFEKGMLPPMKHVRAEWRSVAQPLGKEKIHANITRFERLPSGQILIEGFAVLAHKDIAQTKTWIVLEANGQQVAYPTWPLVRSQAPEQLHTSSFVTLVDPEDVPVPRGDYTLSVAMNRSRLGWLGRQKTPRMMTID